MILLKQALIYFIASLLLIVFSKYVHMLLQGLSHLYHRIDLTLTPWTHAMGFDSLIHQILILALAPLLIMSIPAGLYWLVYRRPLPYLLPTTWCIWLILVLSLVLH